MEAGTRTLITKHVLYLGFAAWHIITHFHVVVPWLLVPLIFAFRMPIFEPTVFNFATVMVANIPDCTDEGIRTTLHSVVLSCSAWGIEPPLLDFPEDFTHTGHLVSRYFNRCNSTGQGHILFASAAYAENFMKSQLGKKVRDDLAPLVFYQHHYSTSLLPSGGEFVKFSDIFVEYKDVVAYIFCMFIVDGFFFMIREHFRWDTFVVRSPGAASVVVFTRIAATIFLIVTVYPHNSLNPIAAAAGAIICAIAILIPLASFTSKLPRGRLSSLFSYVCRVIFTVGIVPLVWHFVLVEKVINPIAGPVFTDSTPSSMMICFWFTGSIVGLTLHGHMDKQVSHMAPAIDKQGLVFAREALKFTWIYSIIQFLISFSASTFLNCTEYVWGEFGDFSFSLVGRMFFATAFCTFLTWVAALYLAACLDPHPSCSLSIADARLLAGSFKATLNDGCVAYRAYIRVRIVAAACLRWCRCNPDRAVECAFQKSEILNLRDPVKDSVIVNAFCSAIDGYGQDLQCAKLDVAPLKGQSIFLFNWFWQLLRRITFIFVGHGPSYSIVQSNAHSVAAVVRALSAILTVADERVCVGNSVPVAAALQPRVLVSSDILVKAYACIASLARDLGQLQRTLNEKPYEFSLQAFKPGQPLVLLKHPVLDHDMFPVDPRFVDVSDACHTALTQLLYSSRLNEVLEMMEKGNKKEAKGRLEFMKKNSSLPPALSRFDPTEIKDHRLASSQQKPLGRLRMNPARGELDAFDPNLEYKVAFEGVPADQEAWVALPDATALMIDGRAGGGRPDPYFNLLHKYLSK